MKKFDEGKLMFHVGRGEVIAGLDEGVTSMRAGGVRKLRIPPHLGYGTSGAPPKVPPNATLLFDVAVVRIGSRKQVCVGVGGLVCFYHTGPACGATTPVPSSASPPALSQLYSNMRRVRCT